MRWFFSLIFVIFLSVSLLMPWVSAPQIYADDPTATPTPTTDPNATPTPTPSSSDSDQVAQLEQQKADLESKISDLEGQQKTISTTIDVMNDKIKLTENQIAITKAKIQSITQDITASQNQINKLNGSLHDLTKLLLARIIATYEEGNVPPITIMASSDNLGDYLAKSNYMQLVQEHDKKLILAMKASQDSYQNVKQIREDQKQQVEALNTELQQQNDQLDQQKTQQQTLLSQVQDNEAGAQKQLEQVQAELAGFSNFVQSQGGASLLSGQTSCDGWGCYYNQRDSQWGSTLINGQSGFSMAGYGCLITSIAMVASHMGHNVSPGDIATSSGNNFAFDTAMLKYSITVNGISMSRQGVSPLDSALQNGPVIVGIYAYGGTHFVVIKSGSNGNYTMDDPYLPNGHDINFTDHYSLNSIFEMDKLNI